MKKKLGDLTIKEVKEIQEKICKGIKACSDCPFSVCCIYTERVDLDKEIEVEE
jgi:hypothetical protein